MADVKALKDWIESKYNKFKVVRIEGGAQIKEYLKELGIEEGTEVVLEAALTHEHRGPLAVEVDGKEVILAQGIANRVFVEVNIQKRLLELEAGNSGTIKGFEAGKALKDGLEKLGLKEGLNVKVKGHTAEEAYTIEANGQQIELYIGKASKLLVKVGDNILQLCHLEAGTEGELIDIISGIDLEERLKESGIEKGKRIKLVSKKATSGPAKHRGCVFYLTVGSGPLVSIGHGMAEKIMLTPVK